MSWLSKIFGGGADAPEAAKAETYKDYQIVPSPIKEPGGYRVSATITKVIDGEEKSHELLRADTIGSLEEATQFSVSKAKQVIDEQGDDIFGGS